MKSITFSMLLASLVAISVSCKKNNHGSSAALGPIDTIQVQFTNTNNGSAYKFVDTITSNDTPLTSMRFQGTVLNNPNLFTYAFQMQMTDSNKFAVSFQLVLNQSTVAALKPGVYTYSLNPPTTSTDSLYTSNAGDLNFVSLGNNWRGLLSDTVTVTSVENGYASGTFSASFASSIYNLQPQLHIANGSFKGVKIYQ